MQITTPPSQPDQVDNNNDMGPTSSSQPQTPSSSALSAAMATSDRFDFEAEYENLKHNLKFFDEAIPKKKDLERAVEALESATSEKSMLQEHKRQAEAVLGEKKQNWKELRTAHHINQEKWKLRAIKGDDVLFKFDNHLEYRYFAGLGDQIEVAQENLRLLEERRQVVQAYLAIDEVRQGPKTWQDRIDHQDQKIKKCEEEVLEMKQALHDALEQLRTNNRIRSPSNDSENPLLKSTRLKEKDEEIASLSKQICGWEEFRGSMEKLYESNKQTITSLEIKIEQDEPLLKVGMDILRRKQEMEKPKADRDMAAIERGNKAAHFGTALADARRVVSGSVAEEQAWHSKFYGFDASFVLENGLGAPKFLEVVDWHAAVKLFHNNMRCYPSFAFINCFKGFMDHLRSKHKVQLASADIETYLKDDQQGKQDYKNLKMWYEAAYALHKKRRAAQAGKG